MKNYGNSFNRDSQEYNAGKVPIWLHTDEFYPAGCTLNGYAQGSVIPAGAPVYVPKMGAEAVVLETFLVVGNVAADGTSVVLKSVSGAVQPAKGLIVGKPNNGVVAKALALPEVTSVGSGDHEGEYTFTIEANALGTLSNNDIVVMAVAAGSNKAQAFPTGLLLEDVFIGNVGATGTVVTKGQVLAKRIPEVPDAYKPYLTGITFVNE